MIKHVVFFKLQQPTRENIQRTKDILLDMEGKIPQLQSIEVGVDIMRSERSYDLCLITSFASLSDLEAYQLHPAHQQVIEHINKVKESVVAVDYEC